MVVVFKNVSLDDDSFSMLTETSIITNFSTQTKTSIVLLLRLHKHQNFNIFVILMNFKKLAIQWIALFIFRIQRKHGL